MDNLKTYTISYIAWIPGYNDFDGDQVDIQAESEEAAWVEFKKRVKFAKSAEIVETK